MPATPDTLIELTTAPTETHAGIVQSVLNDAGIDSWTQKAPGLDYLGLGGFGFSITTVTVRATDADRARQALDSNRQDSVDIDWSEVNVGEPEDAAAAQIAAQPEPRTNQNGAPHPTKFPIKALFVWIVLLALGMGLADWYAPILMLPVAVFDVFQRARSARRRILVAQRSMRS